MSKITFTDKELKIAAGDVVAAFSTTLPSPEEYEQPFEYSSEFLSRMDVLVKHSRKRDTWTRAAQRVASIIIAFLIGSGVWLAVDVEVRAAFVSWIREVYEESFIYHYFSEQPSSDLQNYEVTHLPENYNKIFDRREKTMHAKIYCCDSNVINFVYYQMFEGRSHVVEKRAEFDNNWKAVSVNALTADFYTSKSQKYANEIIWIDEQAGVVFEISAFLEEQEMIMLAESVCLEK